jgi:DNA ligase-associated metallophosphoesterase
MNGYRFDLAGDMLVARGSGALYRPADELLCVSDLHLGKADRIARRGGTMLPPYETADTLARLEAEIEATQARRVICLGDSFDDLIAAEDLPVDQRLWLTRLAAGRDWIWIAGNHDPAPLSLPGSHRAEVVTGPLTFRHIARPEAAAGEVSGHYHPKARLALRGTSVRRACFLIDRTRAVLPAFGTYTGGLDCSAPVLAELMAPDALAVLTGPRPCAVPMPRHRQTA